MVMVLTVIILVAYFYLLIFLILTVFILDEQRFTVSPKVVELFTEILEKVQFLRGSRVLDLSEACVLTHLLVRMLL